jgi:hypothetical protein
MSRTRDHEMITFPYLRALGTSAGRSSRIVIDISSWYNVLLVQGVEDLQLNSTGAKTIVRGTLYIQRLQAL